MGDSPTSGMPIYTVHTMKPDEIGAVEIVFTDERDARAFTQNRSTDLRVISASVTQSGVRIEDISRLVGHSGTAVTEKVYRHELHAVLDDGAIVMDDLFPTPPAS